MLSTARDYHPVLMMAVISASSVQGSPRHESAGAFPFLQSVARRARHHWRQQHGETLQYPGHCLHTLAGADMEFGHAILFIPGGRGGALMQPLPQQISKGMVIPVPAPLVIQGYNEQVGAFKIFQGFLPGSRGGEQNGITKWATQAV